MGILSQRDWSRFTVNVLYGWLKNKTHIVQTWASPRRPVVHFSLNTSSETLEHFPVFLSFPHWEMRSVTTWGKPWWILTNCSYITQVRFFFFLTHHPRCLFHISCNCHKIVTSLCCLTAKTPRLQSPSVLFKRSGSATEWHHRYSAQLLNRAPTAQVTRDTSLIFKPMCHFHLGLTLFQRFFFWQIKSGGEAFVCRKRNHKFFQQQRVAPQCFHFQGIWLWSHAGRAVERCALPAGGVHLDRPSEASREKTDISYAERVHAGACHLDVSNMSTLGMC